MFRLIVAAGLACGCAAIAFAADDVAALKKSGLIGTKWAVDCSKPESNSNYHLAYRVSAKGVPTEVLITTAGNDKARELRNVQVISDEWTVYTMTDQDGEFYDILTRREGDRKKSWRSIWKDAKPLIVDGKFADGNGQPPWFQLCK